MSLSFSINAKPQSSRLKKPTAAADSPAINYVTEFRSDEAPPPESAIKSIAPLPNAWPHNKKLKNLPNLSQISQSNWEGAAFQFEMDPGSNAEPSDTSTGYGLNPRQPLATGCDAPTGNNVTDMESRKFRENLGNLPDGPGLDEFKDVPVDGFGKDLLLGYGWKEDKGIGRNAKEDVPCYEPTKKRGRGGLGFTDEIPERDKKIRTNGNAGENHVNTSSRPEKTKGRKEKGTRGFVVGKVVLIVNGRFMGMKGKIVDVINGGDLLVVRMSKINEKVKLERQDVVEVGSAEEEKCLRRFKELRDKIDTHKDRTKSGHERVESKSERVNWLRNHIMVRVISQKLKGGRLYLKKGAVVDVVGPGVCDILTDESRELVQGVDQDFLETALPMRGGRVLVLCGRHRGVYGALVERDSQNETCVVKDADSHELLNVKLEQVAEYMGDPSDIGY